MQKDDRKEDKKGHENITLQLKPSISQPVLPSVDSQKQQQLAPYHSVACSLQQLPTINSSVFSPPSAQ